MRYINPRFTHLITYYSTRFQHSPLPQRGRRLRVLSSVLSGRLKSLNVAVKFFRPVWAQERYRISRSRFLAKCRMSRLHQGSFVLLYFVLCAFLGCI